MQKYLGFHDIFTRLIQGYWGVVAWGIAPVPQRSGATRALKVLLSFTLQQDWPFIIH